MSLLLLIILLLVLFSGVGYGAYTTNGWYTYGTPGGIVLLVLILWILGVFGPHAARIP